MPLVEPDYFPLQRGYRLRYAHTSTRFEGLETVNIEFTDIQELRQGAQALAVLTRSRLGQNSSQSYLVLRESSRVLAEGGVLGMPRLEFERPPAVGRVWRQADGVHTIASLDASIEVPAGKFARCLRVNTLLADGGTAIRYYAPGVGYVYEEYSEKKDGSRVALVAINR